jgi:hypothetical protein
MLAEAISVEIDAKALISLIIGMVVALLLAYTVYRFWKWSRD